MAELVVVAILSVAVGICAGRLLSARQQERTAYTWPLRCSCGRVHTIRWREWPTGSERYVVTEAPAAPEAERGGRE